MAKKFTFHRFEMKSCGTKINPVRAQLGSEADVAIGTMRLVLLFLAAV